LNQEISIDHFFAIFKVSRPETFETETSPQSFETETRVVVKINPNIPSRQRQLCMAKKYPSIASERTEENSGLGPLSNNNERDRKLYA